MSDTYDHLKGKFIVFEGIDFSGKTTVLTAVAKFLAEQGLDVVMTREPGGTWLGERTRDFFISEESKTEVEVAMLSMARGQHVHEVIDPALRRSAVVLCDRYQASTFAYQGLSDAFSSGQFERLQRTFNIRSPDYEFLLKIDEETHRKRMEVGRNETLNRLDLMGARKLFKIQDRLGIYFDIQENMSFTLDGRKHVDEVLAAVLSKF